MESEERLVLDEAKNVLDQYAKLILKRDKLIKKDMPERRCVIIANCCVTFGIRPQCLAFC